MKSTQNSKAKTQSQADSIDNRAGQSKQSSHNNKSHVQAGSQQGAGGGKKRERQH